MPTLHRTLAVAGLLLTLAVASIVGLGQAQADQPLGETQPPPCRAALLIIDVQSAWLGPDALTIDHILVQEKTAAIAETARANGIPVVFVKDIAYRYRFTDKQLEIAPPLAILEGDHLVEKTHPNGFLDTPLAALLQDMGITTLLITGYASHECVKATVAGALQHGFEVIIVADGHSGGNGDFWARRQNQVWTDSGLLVLLSTQIDFAALCAEASTETGG
ncbi:MAG: isochorismatase family protein [Candidatus Bipolaricaulia bacterium]